MVLVVHIPSERILMLPDCSADALSALRDKPVIVVGTYLALIVRPYINEKNITYGSANLIELFKGSDQQNIYVTYYAAEFYRPQKPIYIQYVNEEELLKQIGLAEIKQEVDKVVLNLSGYQFGKATLKQYIYPTSDKNGKPIMIVDFMFTS